MANVEGEIHFHSSGQDHTQQNLVLGDRGRKMTTKEKTPTRVNFLEDFEREVDEEMERKYAQKQKQNQPSHQALDKPQEQSKGTTLRRSTRLKDTRAEASTTYHTVGTETAQKPQGKDIHVGKDHITLEEKKKPTQICRST